MQQKTSEQKAIDHNAERAEREAIFLREHFKQSVAWEAVVSPFWFCSGIGHRLIETPPTTGSDTCDVELDTGQIGTAKWDFVYNRPDGPVYAVRDKQNKKPGY
jgi:hypothetical protein